MYKLKVFLLPVALLLAFMALACAPPDDDAPSSGPSSGPSGPTIRNIPDDKSPKEVEELIETDKKPSEAEEVKEAEDEQAEQAEEQSPEQATITGASYNVGTALLTLQGTHLSATSATQAQIQTITVAGLAFSSYTATATGADSRGLAKGKYRIANDGTALWLKLTDDDKDALNGKTGMDSNGLKEGLLSVGTGAWAGLNTAKDLTVSGNPAITRATYDVNRGVLVITGTNLPKAFAGWELSKLTLVSGDGTNRLTLPRFILGISKATGSGASATSLTITLSGSVKDKADAILVKDGVRDNAGAYNLEAAAGFAGGRAADTTNPITVSGYTIANASYSANTGELTIFGSRLPTAVAEWDFSKLTIVSHDGTKKYTLPRHSTVGANRATGTVAAIKGLKITLSGSVKQKAEAIMQESFTVYKFEAAAGFIPSSPEEVILTSFIARSD